MVMSISEASLINIQWKYNENEMKKKKINVKRERKYIRKKIYSNMKAIIYM